MTSSPLAVAMRPPVRVKVLEAAGRRAMRAVDPPRRRTHSFGLAVKTPPGPSNFAGS
jgi:hypothetical protein